MIKSVKVASTHLFVLILYCISCCFALSSQDTIYDYNNRILYIHLNGDSNSTYGLKNELFKIPFNSKFTSGDSISNYTITPPANNDCSLVVTSKNLLSFCPSETNLLNVAMYDSQLNNWKSIKTKSGIMYYNDSTYLNTQSDETGIYIFSGFSEYSGKRTVSNQMVRLDTETWDTSDASSRIQPHPFYKSTSIKINSNTEAMFGGISGLNTLVSMMEIPLWQYNSWTERPCNAFNNSRIASRVDSVVLPIFYNTNKYLLNETLTTFEVSSVLMLGGNDLNGTAVVPNIASLDISTNKWKWNDVTNQTDTETLNGTSLLVEDTIAAAIVYDTLMMIEQKDPFESSRNSEFTIKLFNATTFRHIDEVDYTKLNNLLFNIQANSQFNKSLTIALSVVIPVLFVILLTVLFVYMYKKYKAKKEEERYGREVKEIVDFYENQHKRNSELTLTSDSSDYKSSDYETYFSDDIKINDYEDGDNLSINSWKRKRREFQHHSNIFDRMKPSFNIKRASSLKRTLSAASSMIQQTLSRGNTQRTINQLTQPDMRQFEEKTRGTDSINENPFHSSDLHPIQSDASSSFLTPLPTPPPPAVPKHSSMFTLPDRTDSLLYHIPENTSVSTFHSQNLGYLPVKSSNSSPQQNYMKQIGKHNRTTSLDSSMSGSIYSVGTNCGGRSPSHSMSRSPSRSPKRPLSIVSVGSVYTTSEGTVPHLPPHYFGDIEEVNEDETSVKDVGSIKDTELDNFEVQVLVGSKRRSKLRVVNGDDLDVLSTQEEDQEGTERCVSSSSQNSNGSEVRKRIVSDEYNDDSFVQL